ncbi:MarR family transcriptional regulator [Hyphomicrobium sp.]|uniref:MarR family winged helix-turn-helix transcriptional regulator n=1 Tax=Hyphomicrobium sp. TaxID=82 RepID=UPI002C47D0C2|nr:MarR family transcriptional regulator [Hyphomicrobium sp.]HRN88865.1 MarR family transcriptional regulator [Hyphomicrobium sp.]HRQ27402.1 MarR family transcriptional regulator [Hyphomicrobium sp.]
MLALEIGELLLQLGRGMLAERDDDCLTSAQWFALRFFSRANVFSRTLSGLAAYQATTRGTASQTIKALENRDYLVREKSPYDGRSSILTLTEKARKRISADPLTSIFNDIDTLDKKRQEILRDTLRHLVGQLGTGARRQAVGSCGDCIFLLIRRLKSQNDGVQTNFYCKCIGMPVSEKELELICTSFQARAAAAPSPSE